MANRNVHRPEPDDDDERDEVPLRKKKKKKKKRGASYWPMVARYGGAAVVVLGLAGLVIWVVVKLTGGGPPAQPVTAWERFTTEENEFSFDYPAGWRAKGYGLRGRREVEVKGSSATINVQENLAGSLVGDIANAAARGKPVPDELSPVAQVHEVRRPQESSSYQEEPAVTVMTKFGKARRSTYKDGSKRGYRATVLLTQTALDVFCECRDSDWETLRPAFERVIESLGRGGS
jgi:hypothetical protein